MSKYCELLLYLGKCPADGLPEGRLYRFNQDPLSRNRIVSAIGIIERYLLPSQKWGLIIDYNNLVRDNAEADMLAAHARKHFNGCREILEPHMCMHGKIIFARKIRFDGCTKKDASSMIEIMKKSGHIPNELRLKAERIPKTSHSRAVTKSELHELMNQENEVWKSAFKFYSED